MKGKTEKILCGFSSIFPKYLGKYARKMRAGRYETGSEGKFASRWRAKSPDALCAVLPVDFCRISAKKPLPREADRTAALFFSGQRDGKSARRLRAKPSGGFCAVLPKGEYRSLLPLTRKIPEPLDKFRSVMYNSICNLSKL